MVGDPGFESFPGAGGEVCGEVSSGLFGEAGDGDGEVNVNIIEDPNQPMIGEWQQISELRYDFEEGTGDGRACLGELDPELPSKIFAYSNGKLDMYFYECTGGNGEFDPVQSEELFSVGGNWEQIGSCISLPKSLTFSVSASLE